MRIVTRDTFMALLRAEPDLQAIPVVGTTVSVMQYLRDGRVVLSATYRSGCAIYRAR